MGGTSRGRSARTRAATGTRNPKRPGRGGVGDREKSRFYPKGLIVPSGKIVAKIFFATAEWEPLSASGKRALDKLIKHYKTRLENGYQVALALVGRADNRNYAGRTKDGKKEDLNILLGRGRALTVASYLDKQLMKHGALESKDYTTGRDFARTADANERRVDVYEWIKAPKFKSRPQKRVSQIVYYEMSYISLGHAGGRANLAEEGLKTAIDAAKDVAVDGPLALALTRGEKIGDEKKRRHVTTSGDQLKQVDILLYDEFESSFAVKFFRKTGSFTFHWGDSKDNNIVVTYTKVKYTKGEKEAYLWRTTETVDRWKFLRKTVSSLKIKILHIDNGRKHKSITSQQAKRYDAKAKWY